VNTWASKNLQKKENTARALGHVVDADPTVLSSGVTIYIYVGIVLGKWPKSSDSKNMSNEEKHDGHAGKWFDNDREQRDA
jgi:hypothetical protein